MKLLRIWLLVLLAALLPVRGALATAMLCAPAIGAQGPAHTAAAHHDHHDHPAHAQPAGDAAADSHDGGAHDKCSLCASCCATVPLLSSPPGPPEPFDAVQQFPDLCVPAPSFVSDGQERPPRSI